MTSLETMTHQEITPLKKDTDYYFPPEIFKKILDYSGETVEQKRDRRWKSITVGRHESIMEGEYEQDGTMIKITYTVLDKDRKEGDGKKMGRGRCVDGGRGKITYAMIKKDVLIFPRWDNSYFIPRWKLLVILWNSHNTPGWEMSSKTQRTLNEILYYGN